MKNYLNYLCCVFQIISVDNQSSIPTKKAKRVKLSKSTRQRLRKRRQLFQDDFDGQGLNLVATFKDVTGCTSFKERQRKSRLGRKILSKVALKNKFEFKDLGDQIIVKPYIPKPQPLLLCLVTPPYPGISQERITKLPDFPHEKRSTPAKKFNSRPIFKCKNCILKAKSGACFDCSSINYYYTPPVVINCSIVSENTNRNLRDRLRDLFGE